MSICKTRVEVENQIKLLADSSWLTPSQHELYERLKPFIGSFHKVINIYGPQGVGKTFFAHVLFKGNSIDYVSSIDQLHSSNLPMVVDNADFDRMAVRGIRNEARKYDVKQIIIVTRYRAEDSIPALGLELNQKDLDTFRANLYKNLDIKLKEISDLNLWEHLKLLGGGNVS